MHCGYIPLISAYRDRIRKVGKILISKYEGIIEKFIDHGKFPIIDKNFRSKNSRKIPDHRKLFL